MITSTEFIGNRLRVTGKVRESKGSYGGGPIDPDSQLWFELRNYLKENDGRDWIKKRMCADGHLVDDLQQYIRTRDGKTLIHFGSWAITSATDVLDDHGEVYLEVTE